MSPRTSAAMSPTGSEASILGELEHKKEGELSQADKGKMTHGLTHSINHIIHTQRHQHIANKDNTFFNHPGAANPCRYKQSCTMKFQSSNLTPELEQILNTIKQILQSANKCSKVAICALASNLLRLSLMMVLFTWHQMKHKTKHDYKLMMFETQIKCHLLHDLVMARVLSQADFTNQKPPWSQLGFTLDVSSYSSSFRLCQHGHQNGI